MTDICNNAHNCGEQRKAANYLVFAPSAALEMMMDRCHFKESATTVRELINSDLNNVRCALYEVYSPR